jgi:hypothetical protein
MSMLLSPHDREAYSDALRPPPGYRFDDAVAATYALDLTTLLTVPLHLALYSGDQPVDELLGDGIALLEALRKTASRISVFCQRGRIDAPDVPRPLYSLLEPMVHEAAAPGGGAFHPKLWLIRFVPRDDDGRPARIRALVLSRNLTADRCWDLALSLDGEVRGKPRRANRGLVELVRALPGLVAGPATPHLRRRADGLARDAARCTWDLPGEFESLTFHALGLDGTRPKRRHAWLPADSQRLVVISPFVSDSAVRALAATAVEPIALVSRADELAALSPSARDAFARLRVMDEAAEAEDGQDLAPGLRGLHAKAYVWYQGWRTHVVVGSANATAAGLVTGQNVELLAELVGKASRVGDPRDLLSEDGLGKVLTDYHHDEANEPDAAVEDARARLEDARAALAAAGLRLRCEPGEDGRWRMVMEPPSPVPLPDLVGARAWPVTLDPDTRALDLAPLARGEPLEFEMGDVAHLTTFIAFELATGAPAQRVRFVLLLPAEGLPTAERDASIIRMILANRDGFLRYLLLLLAAEGEELGGTGMMRWSGDGTRQAAGLDLDDLPLLEAMTRAYCRDVAKLRAVRRLVEELAATEGFEEVVPAEFQAVWGAFEAALGRRGASEP